MEPDGNVERDEQLARAFGALANPVRLALLRAVSAPKALAQIEARTRSPARTDQGRPQTIARQTVKEHLARLMEADMVHAREAERASRPVVEYALNHQALFALSEDLRDLARIRPAREPDRETADQAPARPAHRLRGQCLVLVKGIDEGRSFDLTPPPAGARTWVIGRRRGLDVALDFDPFVSSENAAIVWENGAYLVEDLRESRNGTTLNFDPLPKGERHALRHGDLVGVGRTLLMFRA